MNKLFTFGLILIIGLFSWAQADTGDWKNGGILIDDQNGIDAAEYHNINLPFDAHVDINGIYIMYDDGIRYGGDLKVDVFDIDGTLLNSEDLDSYRPSEIDMDGNDDAVFVVWATKELDDGTWNGLLKAKITTDGGENWSNTLTLDLGYLSSPPDVIYLHDLHANCDEEGIHVITSKGEVPALEYAFLPNDADADNDWVHYSDVPDVSTTMTTCNANAFGIEAINDYVGKTLTMKDMGIVRRLAKSAKNSIDPDEARIGREILKHIDDNMRKIPGVSEKYMRADKLWSMGKKSELLDKAVSAAKETASGFENGLRIEFRKLLKKSRDGKLQLSPQETASMQRVVDGSIPTNVLKGLGKLGPAPGGAGNALLAVLAGTAGYAFGGPLGMGAIVGGGYASRLGAQALSKGAAERARGVVAGAKPTMRQVPVGTQGLPRTSIGQGLAQQLVPQQPRGRLTDELLLRLGGA